MAATGPLHDINDHHLKTENGSQAADTSSVAQNNVVNGKDDSDNGRNSVSASPSFASLRAGTLAPDKDEMETPKTNTDKIRQIVVQSASEESKKKINKLLSDIKQLPDLEKLLLYLQLPTGSSSGDAHKSTLSNPLGNRFEVTQTITWIKTHLEENSKVSLPKQEVYDDYCHFCNMHSIKSLSTPDFGKAMKQVFPKVRARRLGTRGNSKYCYAGLRKRINLDVPKLPSLSTTRENNNDEALSLCGLSHDILSACSYVILEWARKLLDQKFDSLKELACYLVESNVVDVRSFGAFTVLSLLPNVGKGNQASVLLNQSGGNKHRDAQLQLQRKLQEKEQIREQKRKMNEMKAEKFTPKERRRAASGPCARSTKMSLVGGNTRVCSMPTTPLPARDSSPLSRCDSLSASNVSKISNGQLEKNLETNLEASKKKDLVNLTSQVQKKAGKVAIPRICSTRQSPKVCLASTVPTSIIFVPQYSQIGELTKNQTKRKQKYKPIQPKPSAKATETQQQETSGQSNADNLETDIAPAPDQKSNDNDNKNGDTNSVDDNRASKRLSNDNDASDGTWKRSRVQEEEETVEPLYGDNLILTAELFANQDFVHEDNVALLSDPNEDSRKVNENEASQVAIESTSKELGIQDDDCLDQDTLMMDFMDGSSTSMEQDEELSQYFSEQPTSSNGMKRPDDLGQSAQLTQLRRLLEHELKPSPPTAYSNQQVRSRTLRELLTQPFPNGMIADEPKVEVEQPAACALENGTRSKMGSNRGEDDEEEEESSSISLVDSQTSRPLPSMEMLTGFSLGNAAEMAVFQSTPQDSSMSNGSNLVGRRRVSFPNNLPNASSSDPSLLPPCPSVNSSDTSSPNTRCRSFNFTPISPRQTPLPSDGKPFTLSQPPSATESPFMSPSNTPVPHPRSRHNSGQAMSSYGTTPRTTPYPSEQSSSVNSPFISPHPTPVPFSRSRHNSSQSVQRMCVYPSNAQISPGSHALGLLNCPSRSRHSSGAAMSLMSPRSAPLSPMNYMHDSEMSASQFSLPTVGDTPQMRSRHNSNSSIPPMSPRSAPLSPQTSNVGFQQVLGCFQNTPQNLPPPPPPPPVSLEQEISSGREWQQNPTQDYAGVSGGWCGNGSSRLLARQRHASMGATVHHLPSTNTCRSLIETSGSDVSGAFLNGNATWASAMGLLVQRSHSVPIGQQLVQNRQIQLQQQQQNQEHEASPSGGCSSYSYPATPSAAQFTDLMDSSSRFQNGNDNYQVRKSLTDLLGSQPTDVADDLQKTLEDLQAMDNDYFARELDHQDTHGEMQVFSSADGLDP